MSKELQKWCLEATGNEKYYGLIKDKLYESLRDNYNYNEEADVLDLLKIIEIKCIGSLHKFDLNSDDLERVMKYIRANISKFKLELLQVKMIKIEMPSVNKFKKVR